MENEKVSENKFKHIKVNAYSVEELLVALKKIKSEYPNATISGVMLSGNVNVIVEIYIMLQAEN